MLKVEQIEKLMTAYLSLLPDQQTYLLSMLTASLTISARDSYPTGEMEHDPETIKKSLSNMIGFNEIQHNVTSQLASMIRNDRDRYPDDVFLRIILEKAESSQRCEEGVLWALKISFNALGISLDNL